MGVYIEELKMPKNVPLKIWLLPDGNARIQTNSGKLVHFKAIEVKAPHGRLGDLDALLRYKGDCYDADGHLLYAVGTGSIMCAPTIIEAEGKDNG